MCHGECAVAFQWMLEDKLGELVGPWNQTPVVRRGSKHLYPLSHLATWFFGFLVSHLSPFSTKQLSSHTVHKGGLASSLKDPMFYEKMSVLQIGIKTIWRVNANKSSERKKIMLYFSIEHLIIEKVLLVLLGYNSYIMTMFLKVF